MKKTKRQTSWKRSKRKRIKISEFTTSKTKLRKKKKKS